MTMVRGQNFNHPVAGSSVFVEPIRDPAKIAEIKALLRSSPRNLALFTLGINTNLRVSDILNIRVGQVRGLAEGAHLTLTEKKTGKKRRITMNSACIEALRPWLRQLPLAEDRHFLFVNLMTGRPLSVPSVCNLVKDWCRAVGLEGNYSSHTLRKTWGYHQYHTFGVQLPHLMWCFNHSSQRQTLDYLGIQPDDIDRVYSNVI
jgi:integrase